MGMYQCISSWDAQARHLQRDSAGAQQVIARGPPVAGDPVQVPGDAFYGVEDTVVGDGPAAVDGGRQRSRSHVQPLGAQRAYHENRLDDVLYLIAGSVPLFQRRDPPAARHAGEPDSGHHLAALRDTDPYAREQIAADEMPAVDVELGGAMIEHGLAGRRQIHRKAYGDALRSRGCDEVMPGTEVADVQRDVECAAGSPGLEVAEPHRQIGISLPLASEQKVDRVGPRDVELDAGVDCIPGRIEAQAELGDHGRRWGSFRPPRP